MQDLRKIKQLLDDDGYNDTLVYLHQQLNAVRRELTKLSVREEDLETRIEEVENLFSKTGEVS